MEVMKKFFLTILSFEKYIGCELQNKGPGMLRGGVGLVMKLTGWAGVVVHEIHRGWGGSCRGGMGHAVKQPKKMLVLRIKI